MNKELLNELTEILLLRFPRIQVILTEKSEDQTFEGVGAFPYEAYTLDMWIESFDEFCDTTKPVYLWGVEFDESIDPARIIVYASLTLK